MVPSRPTVASPPSGDGVTARIGVPESIYRVEIHSPLAASMVQTAPQSARVSRSPSGENASEGRAGRSAGGAGPSEPDRSGDPTA